MSPTGKTTSREVYLRLLRQGRIYDLSRRVTLLFHVKRRSLRGSSPPEWCICPFDKTGNLTISGTVTSPILAEAAGEHYSILILTLATTGLRFGEVSALRVMDVDFNRSRLEVRKAFSDVGGKLEEGLPKSGKTRSVGFPSHLQDNIARHTEHKDPLDRVFTTLEGYLLRKENFRDRVFSPAKTEASETLGTTFPPITIHDLRHTAASLAISSGANVKVLQRMLGHATADMTINRYGHLFESDVDSVAARMNQLFTVG